MPDEFLQEQQKMALQAMKNASLQAWQVIKCDTNIKPLIRERPLTSVLAAAVGGLVAGYVITPPRGGRQRVEQHDGEAREDGKGKHRSFLVTLEDELAGAIAPTLRTFAATTAGALFSGFQQGYSHGEHPEEEPPPATPDVPQHRIQI